MPPTVPFFNESIEPYAYDPDEAGGCSKRPALGDGFETDLWYMPIPRPYMPDGKGIAQAMQQDLKEVGINAKLVTCEWGTYLEEDGHRGDTHGPSRLDRRQRRPGQLPQRAPRQRRARTKEDALNIAYYKNPEVDELLQQGQSTIDEGEREQAYMRAQETHVEDAPWVPIAYAKPPLGFQQNVQGYQASPTGGEAFNTVAFSGGGA